MQSSAKEAGLGLALALASELGPPGRLAHFVGAFTQSLHRVNTPHSPAMGHTLLLQILAEFPGKVANGVWRGRVLRILALLDALAAGHARLRSSSKSQTAPLWVAP